MAMATGMGSLNDDPGRPNLHHGKPVGGAMTETDLPKLVGLPPNTHQMVAVSDAANRDPHEFARDWADATERATVLEKMQGMARAQLAAYKGAAVPAVAPAVKEDTTTRPHRTTAPAVAAPEPLLDEELKAYTLSYGGAATYVYTAHTAGTGAQLRYVTVVAQADGLGELKPAIQSVTDAAHLDRTPRMKFVDVVDAEASNRASLLFELRGQNARQFGLRTFGVDWGGVYYGTRAFLPMLLAADEGHVVNTSSVNGLWASIGPNTPHTAYSAAKFAVRGFTEALIADFRVNAPHLRASVVMPGHIGTSIVLNSSKAHGRTPESLDSDELDDLRKRLVGRGLPLDGVSDEDLRKGIQMMGEAFRDAAPTTAAQAATIILEGVRQNRWRILVGEDAEVLDAAVRADPERAYEPPFWEELRAKGHFGGLGS